MIQLNDYSLYRRHQNNCIWMKHVNDRDVHLNNAWVMSYNSYLTRKYSAHINVKICESIQIIKYVHKYMYKEKDQTIMKLKNNLNEITHHLNDCYISSNQTAWNLFKFHSHIENSFITRLIMHLSDEQSMYFSKNVTVKQIQIILNEIETTLTAWFWYNQQHLNERVLLYQEFSTHYIYQLKREQRR